MLLIATALSAFSLSLSDYDTECRTLHDAANLVTSNSNVHFCPGKVKINSSIILKNLYNVSFLGSSSTETVLSCTKYGAGLTLVNSSEISVKNLRIENCGTQHNSTTQSKNLEKMQTVLFSSAVYLINCSNFRLENVHISNSDGLGLVLYDTSGVVEVIDSEFYNNSLKRNDGTVDGGGGVYVEFTVCTPGVYCTDFDNKEENPRASNNTYTFKNCSFYYNKASFDGPKYTQYTKDGKRQDHQGLGRGGGLSIQLNGRAEGNDFTIENCNFNQNNANWGGGLYIVLQDSSSHNIIKMKTIRFKDNESKKYYGGGGVDLGFNIATSLNNSVQFEHCKFIHNVAMFGGGVRIYSSQRKISSLSNIVEFRDCQWINNRARFGAAIDIAPHVWEVLSSGFLPVPLFHNCEFRSNVADSMLRYSAMNRSYTEYQTGRGAMMLTKFRVTFSGSIRFVDNSGSSVYLSSSIIETSPQTNCYFINNRGFEGGAIAFVGFSALFVKENNSFLFVNNTATRRGGAVYAYNIDKHNFVSSRSCFIQYNGLTDTEGKKNVTFEFVNNSAGNQFGNSSDCYDFGYSIYSSTLLTCIFSCDYYPPVVSEKSKRFNETDTFKCVGEFSFSGSDIKCQVSTSGGRFDVSKLDLQGEKYFKLYPGREIELKVSVYNDFSQPINAVYYASLERRNNSNIKINQPYSYIPNRRIRVHGTPGSTGVLRLQKLGYREIMLDLNITLTNCPPGYVLDRSNHSIDKKRFEKCVCSALQSSTSFKPVPECNNTAFRARLHKGYWFGYNSHKNRYEYGYCPSGYCANMFNTTSDLPECREKLDKIICGEYRTGRLCGQCRSNYSVHYHGINYQCGTNDSCKYGWLLYIISEILPLTLLFVIATVFNISFTSGAINGFIWFAQMVHSFPVTGKSFIIFADPVYHIYTITKMIYNLFNFDFFSHDKLSFCLWSGATTMDMLVFKFVTVIYAILLVIITVSTVKYCNIFRRCKCFRFSTVKSSIIHGLSSVLVIVFSQCFKVCCRILESAYIIGKGNEFLTTVVYLQGELTPFSGSHVLYAILAVTCMLIMVIPMLLLLIYPLNFKLLKIVKCSDTNPAARCLCHIPYTKLKPFLDSFQSCFKDDYRVFAGLYFVYRALIIFTILVPRLTQRYVLLDSLLVVFLLIHAIAQPYRERVHNIIDGLLFFNLIVITKITVFNYSYSKAPEGLNPLPVTTTLAVLLLNLPLFLMLAYILAMIVRKLRSSILKRSPQKTINDNDDFDEFELTNRDEESDSEDSCEYPAVWEATILIMDPYST